MDTATRLQISGLIQALGEPGERFDRRLARQLIELVPMTSRHWSPFTVSVEQDADGAMTEAEAAGAPGAMMPDQGARQTTWGQPSFLRCGLYKVRHRPGRLNIWHLFAETVEDQTGQAIRLVYRQRDCEPLALLVQREVAIELLSLRLAWTEFRPWKDPG